MALLTPWFGTLSCQNWGRINFYCKSPGQWSFVTAAQITNALTLLFLNVFISSSCLGDAVSCDKEHEEACLVVQGLKVCLWVQGTPVWSLLREDLTCPEATKPLCLNHRAPEPGGCSYWSREPGARAPQQEEPLQQEAPTLQSEREPPFRKTREIPCPPQLERAPVHADLVRQRVKSIESKHKLLHIRI